MSTAAIPVAFPPLQWSHWYVYGPDFQLCCIPECAGLCAIGRKMGSRFTLLHIEAACNTAQAFRRMAQPDSPAYALLQQEQCVVRYVPIAQLRVRTQVLSVIQGWMDDGAPADAKPALVEELLSGEVFACGQASAR